MHFGLHLVRKGVITSDQFVAALEVQLEGLIPLGQLATETEVLTTRQVFEVLRVQSDSPAEQFGGAALQLGVLSKAQIAELLKLQSDRRQPIANILVEQGVLTDYEAEQELSAFRRKCERGGTSYAPAMTN